MKIFLVDLKNDMIGHYHIMKALASLPNTVEIDTQEKKYSKKNLVKCVKERIRIVVSSVSEIMKQKSGDDDVVHFLTADKFYYLFWLFPGKLKGMKVYFTIHQLPKNMLLRYMLRLVAKRITGIIVLSCYLKDQLIQMGINNVFVINHSTFYDYSNIASQYTLKVKYHVKDKYVISSLGATRFDKGIDILLNSFKYIPQNIKNQLVLNIAGKDSDFSKEYILKKVQEYDINLLDNVYVLSELKFKEMVKISDLIVVPYRKTFNNVSGPMSESFSQKIPCLLPNHGIFEYYIKLQGERFSFESEDPQSLAHAIINIFIKQDRVPINYIIEKEFQLDNFLNKHAVLYGIK